MQASSGNTAALSSLMLPLIIVNVFTICIILLAIVQIRAHAQSLERIHIQVIRHINRQARNRIVEPNSGQARNPSQPETRTDTSTQTLHMPSSPNGRRPLLSLPSNRASSSRTHHAVFDSMPLRLASRTANLSGTTLVDGDSSASECATTPVRRRK
jgi:hypothetical protein